MCKVIYEWSYFSVFYILISLWFSRFQKHVCDDCVFSLSKPLTLILSFGLWSKSSSAAIIYEVHLSIIQPYIWLANGIDDGALHWILTHQSSTWPWAVVISLSHVFLPFLSLSVILSAAPAACLSLCLLFVFVFPSLCYFLDLFLPSTSFLLSIQSLYITDILLPHLIVFVNHWHICNCSPFYPESVPLTSTGGKCHFGLKMSCKYRRRMKERLQVCMFVS